MSGAYYNEINKYAAQWLRNLIAAGHIAPGDVDERSIEDVRPNEIRGYTQCHFFAGIGIWSYAMRGAGWADSRPGWSASCPCQPYSAAGKGGGFADERHLWPALEWLIEECRPSVVVGEQVASDDAEPWIDLVQTDMEALGYAFGAVPFPSASVGAPHIRDRLYWIANGLDNANRERSQGYPRHDSDAQWKATDRPITTTSVYSNPGPTNGYWSDADWLWCEDNKWRAVEPGSFPVAYGDSSTVGRLCAYGNAINAQQAKIFIEAYMHSLA